MGKYLVWDFPTRLFHWALVLCLAGSWITAEAGYDYMQYHLYCGYTALGLILFRVLWGVVGTTYARFAQFVKSPLKAAAHLGEFISARPDHAPGHSPIGGWATLVLLSLVLVQAGSGMFVSDDIFWMGPYNAVVSSDTAGTLAYIHHINFNILQGAVVLHLTAILWYRLRKGQNLVSAMLNGQQTLANPIEPLSPYLSRALIFIGISIAAMTALVLLAPEPTYLF